VERRREEERLAAAMAAMDADIAALEAELAAPGEKETTVPVELPVDITSLPSSPVSSLPSFPRHHTAEVKQGYRAPPAIPTQDIATPMPYQASYGQLVPQPRVTAKLETGKWTKGTDMRRYLRCLMDECNQKNVSASFLQSQVETRLPDRVRHAVYADPISGKRFDEHDPRLSERIATAVISAWTGTSTGDAASHYRQEITNVRWKMADERIDEFIARAHESYLHYSTACRWTPEEEEAFEWSMLVQPMLSTITPAFLEDFDPELTYTFATARRLLISRVTRLAMRGDPIMRGIRTAGTNNADRTDLVPVLAGKAAKAAPPQQQAAAVAPIAKAIPAKRTASPAADAAPREDRASRRRRHREAVAATKAAKAADTVAASAVAVAPAETVAVSAVAAAPAPARAPGRGRRDDYLAPSSPCLLHPWGGHTNATCQDAGHPLKLGYKR
jgi:hypothetical protein